MEILERQMIERQWRVKEIMERWGDRWQDGRERFWSLENGNLVEQVVFHRMLPLG